LELLLGCRVGAEVIPVSLPLSEIRVLVVDDLQAARHTLRVLLAEIGVQHIDEAHNGNEAITALKGAYYHSVICDWMMPEGSGLELLKRMRSDPALRAIPFVMVTGKATKENVLEAIKNGITAYVVKPITQEALRAALKKSLPQTF
jgi:two-component system, chemotaxis family, chemotaxis protein CheY